MDGITGGTVLALHGVFPGTAGTLVGQHPTARVEVQRDHRQRADTERAEPKDAILEFPTAAQRVESILDREAHRAAVSRGSGAAPCLHGGGAGELEGGRPRMPRWRPRLTAGSR
ncbi:hypothetical protein HUT19_19335 [Streptomyces sp. NA02950]|uniref:hypothetical protein n=1 Tax=Streptomyces sp. NA02950 TaxID=2742137 RepID=UPI0015905ED6|nr:hypothetical protein [Streptomyces sp. NA02950]QKV93643.1 hypothetical protein HUT19_19335 [Streptomyces sp. NA02950]